MDSRSLGPRDERAAARTAAALVIAGAGALVVTQLIAQAAGTHVSWIVAAVGVSLAAVGVAYLRWHSRIPALVWLVNAIVLIGVILVMNLLTRDAGAGAQVAFLYPVVYAAAFLRTGAAWTTAGVAGVASSISVFSLLPLEQAITDQTFLLIAIVALTAVLLASGRRQERLVAQLDELASVDWLTGLATRRALEEAARRALAGQATTRTPSSEGTALMLLDVDHFKTINDRYGHPTGDALLVHLAAHLAQAVRAGDTVARFGGDELAILLPGIGADGAQRRAEAMRQQVAASPMAVPDGEVRISVSVGVAHAPAGTVELERLYVAADAALYRAKRGGRDRVVTAVAHAQTVPTAPAPSTPSTPSTPSDDEDVVRTGAVS